MVVYVICINDARSSKYIVPFLYTLVLNRKDNAPVLSDFVKILGVCGAQNLNTIQTEQHVKIRYNKVLKELNFPERNVGEVKLKIKTVHTRCAAELAEVI